MAGTKSAQLKKQQLSDLIECPICTENYEDPRTLPCIHSFCFKCIDQYIKSNAHKSQQPCPLCRKEFALPEGGAIGLPKNFFIGKLFQVEEMSNSIRRSDNRCEACDGGSAATNCNQPAAAGAATPRTAAVYCVECQQRLCATCAELHKKFAVSRGHRHIDLGGKKKSDVAAEQLIKHQPTFCDKHPNEPLKLFCIECRVAMCIVCYVRLHNAHKCSDVNEVADEFRQQMRADIASMTTNSTEYRNVLEGMDADRQGIVGHAQKLEQAIRDRAELLKAEIARNQRKLLDEARSVEQRRLKQIDVVYDEVRVRLVSLEGLRRRIEWLNDQGSSGDVVREGPDLHQRAVDLARGDDSQQSVEELGTMKIQFTSSDLQTDEINLVGDFVCRLQGCTKGLSQWNASLTHVIPPGGVVGGVATLGDQLFVVRIAVNQVEVYDTQSFMLQRKLTVTDASNPFGLTSCAVNNCLYVADHYGSKIHKIEPSHNDRVRNWSVASCPVGLSVNRATNVLVACYGAHKIQEHTTDGECVRVIDLLPRIRYPIHVVQQVGDQYVVTHGSWDSSFRVSVVDENGLIVRSYCDEVDMSAKQLNGSSSLTVDGNDSIMLCEWSTKRVVILNSSMTAARDMPIEGVDDGLNEPWSLCLDEPHGRLYVGEWSGQRVLVFNIVAESP